MTSENSIFLLVILFSIYIATTPKPSHPWESQGSAVASLTQTSFNNWAAGRDNSIAFELHFNYSLGYKRVKQIWLNRIELAHGLNDTKTEGKQKTNDKIHLSSN